MTEKLSLKNQPDTFFFKSRFLPKLPYHYAEPSLTYLDISPHGAMPANPYLNEDVKTQQKYINEQYQLLYHTPPRDMPKQFVEDVVISDYVINESKRAIANYEVFMKYSESEHETLELLSDKVRLFKEGRATILNIADIGTNSSIKSVEFGKVSHPYGYRMQKVEPMREEMTTAILERGGVVYPSIAPYRSIRIMPRVERFDDGTEHGGQRVIGFIVKYKRDYGHIPIKESGQILKVIERQIAAFRVDEASGFDQTVLAAMHSFRDKYPKRVHWDKTPGRHDVKARAVFEHRLQVTGCKDFIERAVQSDSLEDFVVPISTLLYGSKEAVEQKQAYSSSERIGHLVVAATLQDRLDQLPSSYVESDQFVDPYFD